MDGGGWSAEGRTALVGRAAELAALRSVIGDAASGATTVVLVRGPAGVGKSALVQAAAARVESRVVIATDPDDESVPYSAVDLVLQASGASEVPTGDARATGADPPSVGAAVLGVLGARVGGGPTLLLIDDVQWLDEPSAQALAYAFRRLGDDGVVVLMTARDDVDSGVPPAIARVVYGRRGRTLDLGGLDVGGVAEMASGRGIELTASEVHALTDHTGGNPLWVGAALDDLPRSAFRRSGVSPIPPPKTFAALITARLAAMSPDARSLVEAAAVVGPRVPIGLAADIVETADFLAALDEIVAAGLLVLADQPPARPGFAHPMVRSSVYHQIPLGRRASLHRAAAAGLDDPWVSLRHRVAAVVDHDEALVGELVDLAETERSGSPARAAAAYELAASIAADTAQRDDLLLRALGQRLGAGLVDGGIAVAAQLSEGAPRSIRRTAVEGSLANYRGDPSAARALLLEAWESLNSSPPDGRDGDLRASIASDLAAAELNQGHIEEAAGWARQALAIADGRRDLTVPSRLVLVMALGGNGETVEAIRSLLGDGAASTGGLGMVELWNGDPVAAAAYLRVARESSEAELSFMVRMGAALFLCEAAYRTDDWDESIRLGEMSASNLDDAGVPWLSPLAHANAALPLIALGRLDDAAEHIEQAQRLTPGVSRLWPVTSAALLAGARGEMQEVADLTLSIVDDVDVAGLVNPGLKPWRCIGAEALAALGEPTAAESMLEPAERWMAHRPTALTTVQHARARLSISIARGDHDGADAWYTSGMASACPSGYEVAQLQLLYGAHLRRAGKRNRAAEILGRAHRGFTRVGATKWAARVEREQSAGGLTPARRGEVPDRRLTPTELVVAGLVARGRTNKEVAGELVVSPKTIEFHLGSIYRKLGVRNRVELTSFVLSDDPEWAAPGP
jgi:DNA-binding CsgD family transcriptional regulator